MNLLEPSDRHAICSRGKETPAIWLIISGNITCDPHSFPTNLRCVMNNSWLNKRHVIAIESLSF